MQTVEVVAAVIRRPDGRYLACRRAAGRSAAGFWEFPGGKIEIGESPEQALARELLEELGLDLHIGRMIDRRTTLTPDGAIDLACYEVSMDSSASISSTDHDEIVWCSRSELAARDWALADRPVVALLTEDD
ncbi:NUDIX domain-containing protein [Curtobacterium flaccumfaciens]|uniref:NUDIX domain-containing protein n=1 Tax=Curtobacterium flaccumfaciens TaxID=2035 RepID=UPI0022024652|nr:NUDIX domain-containing protein [Curtobacterium flaccumfaciens]UWD83966.1 NUDIX domain-containing protein [Curtobacterium flaccumfaciens]